MSQAEVESKPTYISTTFSYAALPAKLATKYADPNQCEMVEPTASAFDLRLISTYHSLFLFCLDLFAKI